MDSIEAITNARLRNHDGLWTIRIDGAGTVSGVDPADSNTPPQEGGRVFDAAGALVIPPFVDAHLHLDLAHSIDLVPPNESGTLLEAIRLWADAKRGLSAENVRERAVRAAMEEVGFGVGAIRTHVDVGTAAGLRLAEGVLAAREQLRGIVDIEIVTFPQDGLIRDPGALEQMREAMRLGCDLIGGIPHVEATPADAASHIAQMLDLAESLDVPVDCHIDETDAPESRCTEVLAAETRRRALGGRVTASHVCALASYSEPHARRVISQLAEAGVHVVCNPGVNLHLQGRFDRYPKRRGLTRVRDLREAGVVVAAGQDCIRDPFYPLGSGNMLEVAHLLIHAEHLSSPDQIEYALDTVSTNPATILGLEPRGPSVGARADMVVLDAQTTVEAVRLRQTPRAVLRAGRLIGRHAADLQGRGADG